MKRSAMDRDSSDDEVRYVSQGFAELLKSPLNFLWTSFGSHPHA